MAETVIAELLSMVALVILAFGFVFGLTDLTFEQTVVFMLLNMAVVGAGDA